MLLDYGIIGNCYTCAIVSKEGSIDWMCYPDFSSPSVFARILDKNGGFFEIKPEKSCEIKQKYIENTNILETIFECKEYSFKIIDFFPRYKKILQKKGQKLIRENRFIRILEPIRGIPELYALFKPKLDYSSGETRLVEKENSLDIVHEKVRTQLITNIYLNKILNDEKFQLRKRLYFVFGEPDDVSRYNMKKCLSLFKATKRYWEGFVKSLILPEKNSGLIIRSALCLKLLTFSKTGAIIAAPTTSIPEEIGSKRNWDYRYCWVRDASMTIDALYKIGRGHEAKRFIDFIMERVVKDDHIQIMYGIHGETRLSERTINHLNGFKGSKPVRIGNAAYNQIQNDVYGELINVIYLYYVYYGIRLKMPKKHWKFLSFIVNQIKFNWEKPDQGIWEFRESLQHFTYSKMMCYIGVDRAIKIAQHFKKDEYANEWTELLEEIRKDLLNKGYNKEKEAFTIFYKSKDLDASLLQMAYYEFLPSNDQRLINTIKKIYEELRTDYFVKRYSVHDDFGESKSSFTICSFWLVEALLYIGEKEKAKEIFDKLLGNSNHLGLFSEDIDIKTKELLGNFPQAYTHIALINCAILFSEWSKEKKKIDWSTINRGEWI